jgi:uncharacterized protein (TIGR00255 family)
VIRDRPEAGDPGSNGLTPELSASVQDAVGDALSALEGMRSKEGEGLAADLEARRARLRDLIEDVARAAEAGRAERERQLGERVREFGGEGLADPALLAQEIVRFVARSDISEEVVRFRTHLDHWGALAGSHEPCGRKLDFLMQELNREINTIGSKAEGAAVSALVVTVKAELERVREQVQNVE